MGLHSEALAHAHSAGSRGLILAWLSWRVSSTLVAFSVPYCSRARPCVLLCPSIRPCPQKSSVLGHGSVELMGGGEALLGGSWHWAFGGVPLARILGLKPLPLSFASMRWVDYLTACCLPSGPAIPRLDGNRGNNHRQKPLKSLTRINLPSSKLIISSIFHSDWHRLLDQV